MQNTCLLILLLFLGLSCSTAPEFERDNENDPVSSDFIPDISNLSVSINPDKTVSLNWNDDSEFEEGFIISKSFNTNDNFIVIDTLLSNATSYTDSSKNLAVNTYYKISAYHSDGSKENLPGLFQKLSFGSIIDLEVTTNGNEITVSSFAGNFYSDKILIEKRNPNSSGWIVVDTLDKSVDEYSFIDLYEAYSIDLQISSLIYTNEKVYKRISNKNANSIDYNLPNNFEVKVLNEAQIEILFDDGSSFEDKFIIYQRAGVTNCCNHPFSELVSLDTLTESGQIGKLARHDNSVSLFQFFIAPLNSEKDIEGSPSERVEIVLHMRPPVSYQLEIDQNNSAIISWRDGNIPSENSPVHLYHFEWSTDNLVFNSSGSLSKTTNSYTINNLDTSKVYYFRARTYNSSYSTSNMSFQKDFDIVKNIGLSLGPDRENDALTVANGFIFQGSKIINLQDYSITGLSNTKTNDLVGGLSVGDNIIYYSNDTEIRFEMYNRESLAYIGSYSDPEMLDYFSINYLKTSNEVLLGFSKFGEDGNPTVVLQRWNEDISELKEEVELRNKTADPCTTISYLVISDNEENSLLLCNGFLNEGIGFDRGEVIQIDPKNFTKVTQILEADIVRDFLFEGGSTTVIYYLSREDIVKYDIDNNVELNRVSTLEYGSLYDLSFNNDINSLYSVGTQRFLSGANSTFIALNKDDLSIIEKFEVDGKYYFVRPLGNNLFYFIGDGSKVMRKTSNWKLN
ncbi:MAG: fibronectin type III domain-containing protein [Balneola sp.]